MQVLSLELKKQVGNRFIRRKMTDPVADYLTRVRNAIQANHKVVDIPASNLKKAITKILFEKGYILNYKFEDEGVQGNIKIALKYNRQHEGQQSQHVDRESKQIHDG